MALISKNPVKTEPVEAKTFDAWWITRFSVVANGSPVVGSVTFQLCSVDTNGVPTFGPAPEVTMSIGDLYGEAAKDDELGTLLSLVIDKLGSMATDQGVIQ